MPPHTPRYLAIHFCAVFVLLPAVLAVLKLKGLVYGLLWLMTLFTLFMLRIRQNYHFLDDWNFRALTRPVISGIMARFLSIAVILLLLTLALVPEHFMKFPMEKPFTWLAVMLAYPILSVLPQELLYRSFFFRYYESWLKTPGMMYAVNALAFGWVHIVMHSWVAIVLSAIGGVFFAETYRKTNSLAAVCFEHALYGCFLFTIGLGYFFYHGNMVK